MFQVNENPWTWCQILTIRHSSSTFWLGLNTEYSHVRLASVGRDVACISAAFLNSKSSRVRASHGAMMAVLSRSKSWSAPENQTNPGAKFMGHSVYFNTAVTSPEILGKLRFWTKKRARSISYNHIKMMQSMVYLISLFMLILIKWHVTSPEILEEWMNKY